MTVIRNNSHTLKTVLDFSGQRYSKNKIKEAVRQLEVKTFEYSEQDNTNYYIHNSIKVGMYVIQLVTNPEVGSLRLKEFGCLLISIYEVNGKLPINLERDGRFKQQYWCSHNTNSTLKIKHLVDAIAHCQRLDGLKAFL